MESDTVRWDAPLKKYWARLDAPLVCFIDVTQYLANPRMTNDEKSVIYPTTILNKMPMAFKIRPEFIW